MGLFIPPNSDKSNKDVTTNDSSKKIIFYSRPSIGLKIWGPLVPASDCLPGLYALTGFQTLIGLSMFRHIRIIWHHNTMTAAFSKLMCGITGSYMIFNSGLEISRLILPYDPWFEEAKLAREKYFDRTGKKANYWFGPWDYKPMAFDAWSKKIDDWVEETERQLDLNKGKLDHSNGISAGSTSFSAQSEQFHSVYMQIRELNKQRNGEVLKQLEFPGFKEFLLQNNQGNNPEFDRPELVLPEDNELKTNLDFLEVWLTNDPWESLARDTDYEIRFIPKFRWIEKLEETQKLIKEHEAGLDTGNDIQEKNQ